MHVTKIGWNWLHCFEIWCSQDFLVIAYCDLDLWPHQCHRLRYILDLILVKIGQIFTKILYSPRFSGHCMLWPWPLILKANQHMNPNTLVIKIGWNSLHGFLRYCIQPVFFGSLPAVILTLWRQNLISTFTNPNTYVTKIGWNSLHWFSRYGSHKVFGTHRLTEPITECLRHRFSTICKCSSLWALYIRNELL